MHAMFVYMDEVRVDGLFGGQPYQHLHSGIGTVMCFLYLHTISRHSTLEPDNFGSKSSNIVESSSKTTSSLTPVIALAIFYVLGLLPFVVVLGLELPQQ